MLSTTFSLRVQGEKNSLHYTCNFSVGLRVSKFEMYIKNRYRLTMYYLYGFFLIGSKCSIHTINVYQE